MSTITREQALATLCDDAYLEHYGVKGMRWGVRRNQAHAVGVTVGAAAAVGAAAIAARGARKTSNQARAYREEYGDDRSTFERRAKKGAMIVGGTLAVVGALYLGNKAISGANKSRAGEKFVELWWQQHQGTRQARKQNKQAEKTAKKLAKIAKGARVDQQMREIRETLENRGRPR
jgi:hypothetical protein